MGIGPVLSTISMIVTLILEVIRLNYVRRDNYYDLECILVSIFWQVPQYFLVGCAEVFTFIGQLEFFYDQAPDAMRSLCSALLLTTVALGNYLSTVKPGKIRNFQKWKNDNNNNNNNKLP